MLNIATELVKRLQFLQVGRVMLNTAWKLGIIFLLKMVSVKGTIVT